jgi:hypothetical protein
VTCDRVPKSTGRSIRRFELRTLASQLLLDKKSNQQPQQADNFIKRVISQNSSLT